MANKDDKWENNVPGKFYVDQQCIDCDLCRETAPGFFTRHDDGGHSYVFKQPSTQEEIDQCMEALEGCPVEAIGADGDDSAESAAQQPQVSATPQPTGEVRG
ncbi:MAG: ferredoxin [Bryobacterales bacterium]|nr:ferredoxin [Opitutaceae bacterium]MCZ2154850.1 ferredoxin [Bryobacterales bacterium]